MAFFDWLYREVQERFTYSVVGTHMDPEYVAKHGGSHRFSFDRVTDTIRTLSQSECPVQTLDCSDYAVIHHVSYGQPADCVDLSLHCGYPTHEELNWDLLTSPAKLGQKLIEEVGTQFPEVPSIPEVPSWRDYMPSISAPDFSGWNVSFANVTDYFNFRQYSVYENMSEYFANWFATEKLQCDWTDFECHQEELTQRFQECVAEDLKDNLFCKLNILKEYASEYDWQEIMHDIQENYMPSVETAAPYLIAASVLLVAGTAAKIAYSAKHASEEADRAAPRLDAN